MKKTQEHRRTLERRLARELSSEDLKRALGSLPSYGTTGTTTCCSGCADD